MIMIYNDITVSDDAMTMVMVIVIKVVNISSAEEYDDDGNYINKMS